MPVQRLNHAVLYVRDVERSVAFYTDLLNFRIDHRLHADGGKVPEAAFLKAEASTNDHDLAFMQIEGPVAPQSPDRRPGLAHLAWEVDTLAELQQIRGKLLQAGALTHEIEHGTTKSLYASDPDGLQFEVCWLVPADRTNEVTREAFAPLDLDAVIAQFGADLPGGTGISAPARH
ncbi:VOC family protein [Streptomyces sp. NBC_01795]|uniref:VOC family protein n=1 Tax=unclassified Streptomyces TaxID=2593676 RepID=UPI002DD8F26D|nr:MULTISPECIES: VOC family protein [unclassified Streptomyces]WSA96885.1 VOC family protein [Streptomyces sp. NBC_01795]WSS10489.1 VOC family protein [Streptomyces sp. NBC_01186]